MLFCLFVWLLLFFFYVRELELLGKQYERIYVKNNYSSVEKMCLMQTLAIVEGSSPCFKKRSVKLPAPLLIKGPWLGASSKYKSTILPHRWSKGLRVNE